MASLDIKEINKCTFVFISCWLNPRLVVQKSRVVFPKTILGFCIYLIKISLLNPHLSYSQIRSYKKDFPSVPGLSNLYN